MTEQCTIRKESLEAVLELLQTERSLYEEACERHGRPDLSERFLSVPSELEEEIKISLEKPYAARIGVLINEDKKDDKKEDEE